MTSGFWGAVWDRVDGFSVAVAAAVALAVLLPARGEVYEGFFVLSKAVVAGLFFLHGLKLSPSNLWAGLTSWRLHLAIVAATFVFFPALCALAKPAIIFLAGNDLYQGVLFLCLLPSTVQSSIAFTSIAGVNVAAAVCAASASSLLGVFATPALVSLLMRAEATSSLAKALADLGLQLVLPFALGQLARPALAGWLERRKKLLGFTDRLSVVFVVYVSFSEGTTTGVWGSLSAGLFLPLALCLALVLAAALTATYWGGKALGFSRADRIAVIFCGSKKSLIAVVPMANVIFPPAVASVIVLPLMIFHQMQLIACSFIARRLSAEKTPAAPLARA